MKKYALSCLFILLTLTILLTSCSRKLGCYYSIDYPVREHTTDIINHECAVESYSCISATSIAQ
jgi:hypothetical protein